MYKKFVLPIRISDCDYLGHVNNTVYFAYILQATASFLPFSVASQLRAERVSIDYQRPAKFGQNIEVELWFLTPQAAIYSIRQSTEIIANARVTWVGFPELETYIGSLLEAVEPPIKLKDYKYHVEHLGKPFKWINRIQTRELTSGGFIDTASFIHWVDEAVWLAIENYGWSFQRMQQENCAVYIVNHEIEVFSNPQWMVGKNIIIVSQLQNIRKVRGTWRHEFHTGENNELIAREYVTGAFVTLDGQIREPASGLIDICLLGAPAPTPIVEIN